jgi:hypothetical protein
VTTDVAQAGDAPSAVPGRRRPRLRGAPVGVVMAIVAVATLAVVVGTVVWGGATGAQTTVLTLVDHDTGDVVYERQTEVGETFELRHTHSVTRREVVETFSVLDETTLAIEELVFDEHGPNLPAGPQHVGAHATYETDGDLVRVRHHGEPIGTLPLMVGSESVDHTVVFEDGQRLRLLDVVRRGGRVELIAEGAS